MALHHIKSWAERHERHITSGSLVVAFIFDNLTFSRVDLLFDNIRLIFYLIVSMLGIAIINLYEHGNLRGRFFAWLHRWLPAAVQFMFGGLFGGFFIFYSRSGTFAGSWPFLLILFGMFVGNEFVRKHYVLLSFQLSVLFFTLFSFFIFYLPIVAGQMGDGMFLLSGVASLLIIGLFIWILSRIVPLRIHQSRRILPWAIGSIYLLMNILYFTNILPPIPLALKDAGVYHYVGRVSGGYLVKYEERSWLASILYDPTVHVVAGEPLYLYSAVFAPTKITTKVFHNWQYYDPAKKRWTSATRASFAISGGRDGGYRGYSIKYRIFPGLWRVNIETQRGQLIGRTTFKVEQVTQLPALRSQVR